MLSINQLVEQRRVIGTRLDKQDEIADLLALAHLEVAYALDAESCREFCQALAGICIRIIDTCIVANVDLGLVLKNMSNDVTIGESQLDPTSLESLEKSLAPLIMNPTCNDHKTACEIHSFLSYALEHRRRLENDLFGKCLGFALLKTLMWAVRRGYRIAPTVYGIIAEEDLARFPS